MFRLLRQWGWQSLRPPDYPPGSRDQEHVCWLDLGGLVSRKVFHGLEAASEPKKKRSLDILFSAWNAIFHLQLILEQVGVRGAKPPD